MFDWFVRVRPWSLGSYGFVGFVQVRLGCRCVNLVLSGYSGSSLCALMVAGFFQVAMDRPDASLVLLR